MNWISLFLVVGVSLAATTAAEERKSYAGYQLVKIVPQTSEAVKFLHKLMHKDVNLDFWSEPSSVGKDVEILVPPRHFKRFEVVMRKQSIDFDVVIKDYKTELEPMWRDIDKRRSAKGGMVFDINDFNTLTDIYSWMATTLMTACRTSEGLICQNYTIGNSGLGKPIMVFKLSKNGANRKAYWLDATIHAREWIATATILQVLDNLVRGGDDAAQRLTDAYDWYILPVMNVDGYEWTWESDRLWRKNRLQYPGVQCIGTDLNRNFDFRWGTDGVSHIPCADTYCGPSAGSEPETKAVQNELKRISSTVLASVTIHSYGNMWMFPWGNTVNFAGNVCQLAADHDELMDISNVVADAIQARYGTQWARGNSCVVIYATSGGTDDWAKGEAGIKNAFCPELRGNSFVIPASQIPMSFNEFWDGIVAMADTIQG